MKRNAAQGDETMKHAYSIEIGENISSTGEKVYEAYVERDGYNLGDRGIGAGYEYSTRGAARKAGQAAVRFNRAFD
jgi:hypothetical protein